MNLVERAQRLLVTPRTEWEVIDTEPNAVQGLFTGYVMILAAIPAVSNFIGYCVVGLGGVRLPMSYGVTLLVITYVMGLAIVYLLALVVDALAPHFGATRSFAQAMKVSAFAPTAAWIAGVFQAVPYVSIFSLVGALYSVYLLYLGLPKLMKPGDGQAMGYLVVVTIAALVLWVFAAGLQYLAIPPALRGF